MRLEIKNFNYSNFQKNPKKTGILLINVKKT